PPRADSARQAGQPAKLAQHPGVCAELLRPVQVSVRGGLRADAARQRRLFLEEVDASVLSIAHGDFERGLNQGLQ
ncbi:unnamed protein product, partial [Ectocarpus fasciculatus]